MRLIIVSHDLSQNALGRAHVIWTLARAAGYETIVRGTSRGPVWEPLRSSELAADVRISRTRPQLLDELHDLSTPESLLVPIKTWPGSLGVCLDVARRTGAPILADIDDPDHSALVGSSAPLWYRSAFRLRMRLRHESPRSFDRLQWEVRSVPRMVSNPVLRDLYGGGHLVPHARNCDSPPVDFGLSGALRIAFVGTPRRHKGLELLRGVVSELADRNVQLIITSDQPRDAQPWERWVGVTDMPAGRRIVARSDVVVVPQAAGGYATAQLPAKLIDAMALGRPIVAMDTGPVRWALGGTGLLVPSGDRRSLLASLEDLFDADLRRTLGLQTWGRAKQAFSVEAVIPAFLSAVQFAASA